jgi:mannosyltransferase OCH1-like enzyme
MNIWLYWENAKDKHKPPYLDLCFETIKKNRGKFDKIILLNEQTIHNYIELPYYWKDVECIAHKTDYLRSRLLLKYGGLWLDSDTVILSDLSWILEVLNKYSFIGWGDDNGPYIGTFACNKGDKLVQRWAERQDKIFYKKQWGWAKLGTDILWEEAKKFRIALFPYKMIAPIDWRDWRKFFSEQISKEDIIKLDIKMITLYNNFMGKELLYISREGILKGNTLLSKIFRCVLKVNM